MLQPNNLLIPLITFIFWSWWTLINGAVSEPQTNLLSTGCSPSINQFVVTNFSIFSENVNRTFRHIREQILNNSKHFATAQQVSVENSVFALFQCRGYISIHDCVVCFDAATKQLRHCAAGAEGGHAVYDGCFLRYETKAFFDQTTEDFNAASCGNQTVAESSTLFTSLGQEVLRNLQKTTPQKQGFVMATKASLPANNNGTLTIYGFAQCTQTITQRGCDDCLKACYSNMQICLPNLDGKAFAGGCFMRYSATSFFPHNYQTIDITPLEKQATKTPVPNSNGSNIYAIAQCIETLAQLGCQDCLNIALRNFQICLPNSNTRTYDAGCFTRYSTTAFFADNQTININPFMKEGGGSRKKKAITGGVVGGGSFLLILLALFALYRRSTSSRRIHRGDIYGVSRLKGLINFSYRELKFATKGFSAKTKLGEGGFGAVYKGTLENGKIVAVKKLNLRQSKKVKEEFETEVKLISNIHHRNLIQLLGYCSDGNERILIYEYMKNTSLDKFLFGENKGSLGWRQRYDIILRTAKGLAYLHEELHVHIIHRDIKTNNILLDDDLHPRIADFGLARLLLEDKSDLYTKFAGTLAYAAPEYVIYGQLSEKVYIYGYGVVILEIMSGEKNNKLQIHGNFEGEYLLIKAWRLYERGIHIELVDDTLGPNDYDAAEVKKIIEIGLLCIQASAELRPSMSEVTVLLQGNDLLENMMKPTMPILIDT